MADLQLPVERFALQHPAVVVAGVAEGRLASGRGEAADAGSVELALAGPGPAIAAPAAGRIDGDPIGGDHRAAPVGQLLNLSRTQPGSVGTTGERHGVEALAGAAHVDADHGGHALHPAMLVDSSLHIAMQVVSFSEARDNFKAVLDRLEADADVTLITRRHAKGAVVMSLDTTNSLMETVHLVRSPANAAHLQRSLEQAGRGELLSHGLIDPDPADAGD